jgi:hypothetical protein
MRRGRLVKACLLCQPPAYTVEQDEIEEPMVFASRKRKADRGDVDITLNVEEFVQAETLDRDKSPPMELIEPLRKELRDAIAKSHSDIIEAIRDKMEHDSGVKRMLKENNLVLRHHIR